MEAMGRIFPNGYWPKGMDGGAQYASMTEFERAIFPIWRGITERGREANEKMSVAEASKQPVLLEAIEMHEMDLAIYESGIKPRREDLNQAKMAELRAKASRAAGG